MLSDHPSKGLCHGCSSAIVVLDNITSQGRLEDTSVWDERFRGGRAGGATPRHDLQGGRTHRPDTSERLAAQYKGGRCYGEMVYRHTRTGAGAATARRAQAWRDRHPADQQPTFDDAVEIARKLLDEGDLGPDARAPVDYRAFFASLEDGGEYALRTWWLPRAKHCSHYWESMRLTAAGYLRNREPMPDALAQWLAAVLDGTLTPPRPRGQAPRRWRSATSGSSGWSTRSWLWACTRHGTSRAETSRAPTGDPPAMPWGSRSRSGISS